MISCFIGDRDNIATAYLLKVSRHSGVTSMERKINRRGFLDAAGKYTLGGLTALGIAATPRRYYAQSGLPLVTKLSRFVANTRYDSIPPKALEMAKTAIMDCLGVAVAG